MSLEDTAKPAPQIADGTVTTSAAEKDADNLDQFRLPAGKDADVAKAKTNTGEWMLTAAGSGALVGIASPLTGQMMREGATSALDNAGLFFTNGPFSKFGSWLDRSVIRSGLDDQKSFGDAWRTIMNPTPAEQLAFRTQTALAQADGELYKGLVATVHSDWVPPSTMKAVGTGAVAGLSDWAVDRGLEWATGVQGLRPNILETSLVTGAAMSPLPGRYKVAAVATAWGIGKLSNIVGLT